MEKIYKLINDEKWEKVIKISKKQNKLYTNIYNGNSLFHLACTRGNKFTIDFYTKNDNSLLTHANECGNTGAHILILHGWFDLFIYLISNYPIFLKMINNSGHIPLDMCVNYPHIFHKTLELMKKNNMINFINDVRINNVTTANTIIYYEKNIDIAIELLKTLDANNIELDKPLYITPLYYCILQDNEKLANAMIDLPGIKKSILTNTESAFALAMYKRYFDLAKKMIIFGADVNETITINNLHIVPSYISLSADNELINMIIGHKNFDYNKKDKDLNTILHFVALRLKYLKYAKINNIEDEIKKIDKILPILFEKCDLQSLNIDSLTPIDILRKYNLLETRIHMIKDLTKISKKNKNLLNIILPDIIDSYYGLYVANNIQIFISYISLLDKYKECTIPMKYPIKEQHNWEIFKYNLENYNTKLTIDILFDVYYFFPLEPLVIVWKNKSTYVIDKKIIFYLKRALSQNKRYIIMAIRIENCVECYHANTIIYDVQKNELLRFEPYGDWNFNDSYHLDKIINDIFSNAINKQVKYIRPGEYLSDVQFQSASKGDIEQSIGDPGGYCGAWSIWFLELKMLNPDIDNKMLVDESLKNILFKYKLNKNPLLHYIRGYGVKLNKERTDLFKKWKINEDEYYSTTRTTKTTTLVKDGVNNFVINYLTKLS
jgi:ankyrin repeat protein